jgi:hypothetical protein
VCRAESVEDEYRRERGEITREQCEQRHVATRQCAAAIRALKDRP